MLHDRLRRLLPLDPVRLRNVARLRASYGRAVRSGGRTVEVAGGPMSLSVEPTTSCNLRCPECPSGLRAFTRPTGMLEVGLLERVLEEAGRTLVYVNLYHQGEPTLHPEFAGLVAACKRHRVYVSTSTNAHFLTEERAEALVESGLDRLIVAVDGLTQETYAAYRKGGRLDRVLEGTARVVEAKRRAGGRGPHVVWQFLAVGPNEHEVPQLAAAARRAGANEWVVKTAQIEHPHDDHPLLTHDPRLRRYDRAPDGTWRLRNPLANRCWRMWQGAVVTWDGRVVPCCFDKDAHHVVGRVGEGRFGEIWHGEAYAAFRRTLFADRTHVPMCVNCSEGTRVYA